MSAISAVPKVSNALGSLSMHWQAAQPFIFLPCPARPSRSAGTSDGEPGVLSQQMLRKYITYAKQTCRPKLQTADYDKVAQVRRFCV